MVIWMHLDGPPVDDLAGLFVPRQKSVSLPLIEDSQGLSGSLYKPQLAAPARMWSHKEHNCERQMLYETLNDDKNIEAGCVCGPENVFRSNANRWDKMRQYDGIAVVTESREAPLPTGRETATAMPGY